MNKLGIVIIALLTVGLLVLAGCAGGSSATGAVPRAPAAPSGGGCGIAAPADAVGALAENTAGQTAL